MHINKTNVVCSKVKTERLQTKQIFVQELMNFHFFAWNFKKINFCWLDVLMWTIRKEITAIHLIHLCQAESWASSQTQSPSTGPLNMQALPEKLKPCQPSTLLRLPDVLCWPPSQGPGILLSFKQHFKWLLKVKYEGEIFFWHTTESLTAQDYCDTLPTITVWPRYSNFVILKTLQDSYT